ncbi:MAG: hypothetical protein DMG70_04830 [Acidobacteria bacterium]|nr:MAG: hypothetical protein DMG70_04830 [Acidobacteriota bacterium]
MQPDSSEAQRFLAVVLEKQGDFADAPGAYQKALELNPGNTSTKESLKNLTLPENPAPLANIPSLEKEGDDPAKVSEFENYIRQGRFQSVEPLLRKYVTQHPRSSWAWYALGYSQFAQKKIGESIESLAKSLQLNLRNAEAHKILGRDLIMIGRFEAAQTEFEQGILCDPNSAEIRYNFNPG